MADLHETTLTRAVQASDRYVYLADVGDAQRGDLLYVNGETLRVTGSPLVNNAVPVMRGYAGSPAVAHLNGLSVFSGRPHRFHTTDPHGNAPAAPDDNPWINITDGRVWRAQGDQEGPGSSARVWELVTTTYPIGALGIRTAPTATPSS